MDFTLYKDLNGFADRHEVVEDILHFTHYPSDVIGGASIGTLAALALWAPPIREATDLEGFV